LFATIASHCDEGKLECLVLLRAAKTFLKGAPAADAAKETSTHFARTSIRSPDINSEFNLGNATARVARRSPQQAPWGSERDGMSQFPQSFSGYGCK
jgi:hypothetical protein